MFNIKLVTDITKLNKNIFNNIVKVETRNMDTLANKILYKAKFNHKYKNRTGNLTRNTVINKTSKNNSINYELTNNASYSIYVINRTKDNFLLKAVNNG